MPDPCDVKEHYQSFIIKKNTESVKQWNVIVYQTNAFQNPNVVEIKYVIAEHSEFSHKLSKNIRQAVKEDLNISLYSDTKKMKNHYTKKM